MYTLQEKFDDALHDFIDRVGEEKAKDFEKTDIKAVMKELKKMQQDQRKAKMVRGLRRVEGFLRAFEQFGDVVETFLNASPFVCFVWGPVKFLLIVRDSSSLRPPIRFSFWPRLHQAKPSK